MKKHALIFLGFILSIVFVSCNTGGLSGESELFKKIVINEDGHFRGIAIGDKIENVKTTEKATLTDEDVDYLYYDISINDQDFYSIAYYFDENGLYEIMADMDFDTKEEVDELVANFTEHFTKKYGKNSIEDDYSIWKTSSDASKQIEIAMTSNVNESGGGYLSIAISDYAY